jgi:hypothetical protein
VADESPDLGAAIRDYLKDSTVLVDSNHVGTPNKIFVGLPDKKNLTSGPPYDDMIVVLTGRGGPGELGSNLFAERVDIQCYGHNEATCKRIARALMWYINPQDVRRKTNFIRKNCRVASMLLESGPITLPDETLADWPYTTVTFIVTYHGVPVSG